MLLCHINVSSEVQPLSDNAREKALRIESVGLSRYPAGTQNYHNKLRLTCAVQLQQDTGCFIVFHHQYTSADLHKLFWLQLYADTYYMLRIWAKNMVYHVVLSQLCQSIDYHCFRCVFVFVTKTSTVNVKEGIQVVSCDI